MVMMNRFKEQYDTYGLAAMLRDIHSQCTMGSSIPFAQIKNELLSYVTKVAIRLCQVEPVMTVIFDAYNAIEKTTPEDFPSVESVLTHYDILLKMYIARLVPISRNLEEYSAARIMIACFARCAFETALYYTSLLDILAEEATRDIRGQPSLLNVFHHTWAHIPKHNMAFSPLLTVK